MEPRQSSSTFSSPRDISLFTTSRRHGPRSKGGCWTCREKKVKCDERQPRCDRCKRLDRYCDYLPRQRKNGRNRRSRQSRREVLGSPLENESHPRSRSPSPSAGRRTVCALTTNDFCEISSPCSISHGIEDPRSTGRDPKESEDLVLLSPLQSSLGPFLSLSAACSLVLSPADHEAIHYFRTSISTTHDTKDPRYSVPSAIFRQAESSPLVMYMVVALAQQEIRNLAIGDCIESGGSVDSSKDVLAMENYGCAMNLMAEAVKAMDCDPNLDTVLAALWLMIVYEQKFGDGEGRGLSSHLNGAASIMWAKRETLSNLLAVLNETAVPEQNILCIGNPSKQSETTSVFACRMIVWLSFSDAAAASYGIGGQINGSLWQVLSAAIDDDKDPLRGFSAIHRYSTTLFRIWGGGYPQTQLLEDLENRQLFFLYGECGQLRYMVAKLASLYLHDKTEAERRLPSVDLALRHVGRKYSELLQVASILTFGPEKRKFVCNIRFIVPFYHATVLDFLRITRSNEPLNERQYESLRQIINLAFQAYKDEGHQAMLRIAWPLFIASLESDDVVHKEWALSRFKSLGKHGPNYRRAFKVLEAAIAEQDRSGYCVSIMQFLGSGQYERFVI